MGKLYIDISNGEKKKEVYDLFSTFSYKKDIYSHYGVSDRGENIKYVNDIAKNIGFDFSIFKKNRIVIKSCLCCGKEFKPKERRFKFCSHSCATKYNSAKRKKTIL